MKIALIGYGAMGKTIEKLAISKGHEISVIISKADTALSIEALSEKLSIAEVVIDFSVAEAVRRNVQASLKAAVPIVEGTTGWLAELDDVKKMVIEADGSLVFGANFSVGVNLFYKIVDFASRLFSRFPDYDVFIEERHHSHKRDAPSGTALKLQKIIRSHIDRDFSITSTRAGEIPGTHTVGFDGLADIIELSHSSRSRDGFALGAILACEWIRSRKGFYEFSEIIEEILLGKN
ncbi:MAG: dihydrodipicolinate reductase [Acidobacteria bacterium]|nr:MAG: dihydrodipicolinate reductase [Acidobacteriota bacterium]